MTTTTKAKLTHLGGCKGPRPLDVTHHDGGITTTHCVDCGAHEARKDDGDLIPPPTNPGPFNITADTRAEIADGITIERAEDKR